MTDTSGDRRSFADLSRALLDEEAAREAADADQLEIRADEDLPGVGEEAITLRQAVATGGVGVLAVLGTLDAVDAFQIAIPSLLGPEIQNSFGVSDAGLAVIGIGGLITTTLCAIPMGKMADRVNRMHLVGLATVFWSVAMFTRGFQATALGFFLVGMLMGIGTSNTFPVQGAVLADAYPISARGRIYAVKNVLGRGGERIAPLLVGGLMLLVDDNWRWAYWIFAWPTLALGIWALFVPDPPRGQFEQKSVLGEVMEEDDDPPRVSLGAVWQRLMAIKTLKLAWISFSIIVFSIIGQSFLVNLYLEDRWGLSPFERAMIGFVPGMLAFAAAPWAAKRYDSLYRESPARALSWVGALFFPIAVAIPIQFFMPHPVLFAAVGIVPAVLSVIIFGMISPLLVGVVPYRLRAQSTALSIMVIFLGGGVLGPIVAGLLSDATDERTAILIVAIPFKIIGGALLIWGARHIRHDLSLVVDEIEKDHAELERRKSHPDQLPAVGLRDIDFSYGPVQVLFGVNLHVDRGETLALLGTNGAGKSTILRVISGLAVPSRGIVSLHGRDITLTHLAPNPGGHGHPAASRGQSGVLAIIHRGQPPHWGMDHAAKPDRAQLPNRPCAGDLPGAGRSARRARQCAQRGSTADACFGHGADARTRRLAHRRTVARPRPCGDRRAAGDSGAAQGRGPNDDHRGTVAQHRGGPVGSGGVHREGTRPFRRSYL